VFSYVDLVRVEIALEAEEQFGVTIPHSVRGRRAGVRTGR